MPFAQSFRTPTLFVWGKVTSHGALANGYSKWRQFRFDLEESEQPPPGSLTSRDATIV